MSCDWRARRYEEEEEEEKEGSGGLALAAVAPSWRLGVAEGARLAASSRALVYLLGFITKSLFLILCDCRKTSFMPLPQIPHLRCHLISLIVPRKIPRSFARMVTQPTVTSPESKRIFPPLYVSSGDAAQDRLAFFHILERLKVCHMSIHIFAYEASSIPG